MTLNEFRSWFQGYTDALDGPPTDAQWEKIKIRVSQINSWPAQPRDTYRPAAHDDFYTPPGRAPLNSPVALPAFPRSLKAQEPQVSRPQRAWEGFEAEAAAWGQREAEEERGA